MVRFPAWIISLLFVCFILFAFSAVVPAVVDLHHGMMNCPFQVESAAVCQSSTAVHAFGWQQMLQSIVTSIFVVFLCALVGSSKVSFSYPILSWILYTRCRATQNIIQKFHQPLFAQGILNPKNP